MESGVYLRKEGRIQPQNNPVLLEDNKVHSEIHLAGTMAAKNNVFWDRMLRGTEPNGSNTFCVREVKTL